MRVSSEAMTKIIDCLQSPLFHVEILDKAIPLHTADDRTITGNEARTALANANLLSSQNESNKPLPILITGRVLSGKEWTNLLMISWNDAVVISVWRVGSENSLSNGFVRRYVTTSVALEAIVSNALKRNKAILNDRTPELYRGCLHDFHRTRETYIQQSQQPKLCEAEEKAISGIFGRAAVEDLKNTFNKIAKDE